MASQIEFDVVIGWEKLPEGWSFVEVAGVEQIPGTGFMHSIAVTIR